MVSRLELNLYRLQNLNLIKEFVIVYGHGVTFLVFGFDPLISRQKIEEGIENYLNNHAQSTKNAYAADRCWQEYGDDLSKKWESEKNADLKRNSLEYREILMQL